MEQEISILLIGMEGIGKHNLARAFQRQADACYIPPLKLMVVTSSTIPSAKQMIDAYDLVVLMVDRTMKCSLGILKDVKSLRRHFVLGKVCCVCFGGKQSFKHEFDLEALAELERIYSPPFYFSSKQSLSDWNTLANSLLCLLLKTAGLKTGHPILSSSLRSLKPPIPLNFLQ